MRTSTHITKMNYRQVYLYFGPPCIVQQFSSDTSTLLVGLEMERNGGSIKIATPISIGTYISLCLEGKTRLGPDFNLLLCVLPGSIQHFDCRTDFSKPLFDPVCPVTDNSTVTL